MIREINAFRSTDLPACHMTFRQGACVVDDPSLEITLLQDRARLACQSQTAEHREKCAFYDNSLTERMKMEQELNDLFDSSIKNHDFKVYLQPKILLETNRAEGAEALVRWKHPEWGFQSPAEFIPLFEKNGFITKLDQYVWDKTCCYLRRWDDEGYPPVPVSVNVSRADIYHADIADIMVRTVSKYGLTPSRLHLEITESAYTEDPGQIIETVSHLRELGFVIEMDDFGSGYSSLNLIQSIPVDTLKIDKVFFKDKTMELDRLKAVVGGIIRMSHSLSMVTVAEGVEYREQVEMLKQEGCDYIQGYIFDKPMNIASFEQKAFGESLAEVRKSDPLGEPE